MAKDKNDNLEVEITQVVSDVTGRNIEELKLDANFWQDLGIDSIKAIEMTVAIEKRYKVRIKDEQIPKISTIRHAVEIVRQALEKGSNE